MTYKIDILVVDDDLRNRSLLADYFLSLGNRVAVVSSGKDATRVIKSTKFDLIFISHALGNYNGIDTASKLRRIDPKVTILILGDVIDHALGNEIFADSNIEVLPKPFSLQDVQEIVFREENRERLGPT